MVEYLPFLREIERDLYDDDGTLREEAFLQRVGADSRWSFREGNRTVEALGLTPLQLPGPSVLKHHLCAPQVGPAADPSGGLRRGMSGLRCTACGGDADYGARFCERCGAQLLQRCSHCGHRLTRTALFCSQCGTSVEPVSQNVSVESVRTDPERRQLTVMFCDLVGSTALSVRLDPEDMRIIISSYHKAAAKAVQDYDGFVAKYMRDGVLAYFGYPKAHEHDAEHAVRAGLAITEVAPTPENAFGETLHVRVGIANWDSGRRGHLRFGRVG
jgi:Adenylate and Guanylate cyclase catalytic domain/Double zinc ribbon